MKLLTAQIAILFLACVDKHAKCKTWADTECKRTARYSNWMDAMCPFTCKRCRKQFSLQFNGEFNIALKMLIFDSHSANYIFESTKRTTLSLSYGQRGSLILKISNV